MNPLLIEMIARERQAERLHAAELARTLRTLQDTPAPAQPSVWGNVAGMLAAFGRMLRAQGGPGSEAIR